MKWNDNKINENEYKYNLNILEMNNMHVSKYIIKDNFLIIISQVKTFSPRPEEAVQLENNSVI